jgi:predicted DNA-binding transcriptional regulator YafY
MEDTLRLHPRMMKFLGSLRRGTEFKAEQYAEKARLSLRQARRDLDFLVEAEEIVRHGRGPATVYRREEGSVK